MDVVTDEPLSGADVVAELKASGDLDRLSRRRRFDSGTATGGAVA